MVDSAPIEDTSEEEEIHDSTAKMAKSTGEEKPSISEHDRLKHDGRHRDNGEIFACESCGRVFENKKSLTRHVETRHVKNPNPRWRNEREKKPISDHARLMRIVNPDYMVQKRKAWTEHKSYREERDLRIRCGKTTFHVHGVFMSQVRS